MSLTGVRHCKAYGDGMSACEGYIEDIKGKVFVRCAGWFGNLPYHFGVEQARAMATVLAAIVAEYDEYQNGLSREYGPQMASGAVPAVAPVDVD